MASHQPSAHRNHMPRIGNNPTSNELRSSGGWFRAQCIGATAGHSNFCFANPVALSNMLFFHRRFCPASSVLDLSPFWQQGRPVRSIAVHFGVFAKWDKDNMTSTRSALALQRCMKLEWRRAEPLETRALVKQTGQSTDCNLRCQAIEPLDMLANIKRTNISYPWLLLRGTKCSTLFYQSLSRRVNKRQPSLPLFARLPNHGRCLETRTVPL